MDRPTASGRSLTKSPARAAAALGRAAVARPGRAFAVVLFLVAAAAPGLLRLELRTDGHALVPPDDPVVRFDAEVRERFGLWDPLVVMVEAAHHEGIYNRETLRRIRDLTRALEELDWLEEGRVRSLATERRDRVYPGTLRFRLLLDPLPRTAEEIAGLREDVEAIGLLDGTLVAEDDSAAAVVVGMPPHRERIASGELDRAALYRDVQTVARRFAGGGHRVSVVGAPAAEALLGEHVLEDLALFLPLTLVVLAVVLWRVCGRAFGALLGLAEVGACLVFTFGVMGWWGAPVYLTTAVLPVVLASVGLADEIHVLWHYRWLRNRESGNVEPGPGRDVVTRTFAEMAAPVTLTSVTTAVGFLSFTASSIESVASFGVFAAVGIAFCWLWTFTAVPAVLGRVAPERLVGPLPGPGVLRSLPRAVAGILRRRVWALGAFAALAGIAGAGLPRLAVQDGWLDGFAHRDPFRRAVDRFHERFAGGHVLLAQVAFDPAEPEMPRGAYRQGPLLDPRRLEGIGRFERVAAALPGVGGVLGPHAHLTTVRFLATARRPEARAIPGTPREVERVLRRFEQALGEDRRREVIDDELARGVVTVFLKDANFQDTAAVMAAVEAAAAEHLAPFGGAVTFAGDVAVSQAMIPAVVRTQITSILLAVLGAVAAVALVRRSIAQGVLAALPAATAVLWTLGVMGWAGIPLGVATSMFCAITLGVGVDFGVHLLAGLRRARERGSCGTDAVLQGVEEAGPAIVADALAVAAGFGVLAVSQVPATSRLGLLVGGALLAACGAALGLLPVLAAVRPRGPGAGGR